MKPTDPLPPVNRIKDFVASPTRSAAKDEDEDEHKNDCESGCADLPQSGDDEDEDADEDVFIGSGGDDDNDDDDDDDEDDDDDSELTPENYLRTKVCLALEESAVMSFGKVIVHDDPRDEEKLLVTMQLDKFAEDEEMPDLEGGEMRDVSVILIFEGKGVTGPKKRILHLEQLSQLFDDKNWKKREK
jgi:hypothetical protein